MSDRPGNWLALARRVGLVYAAAAGVGSAAVVGLLISVRRRTRCVGCVRQRVRTSLFVAVEDAPEGSSCLLRQVLKLMQK